MKIKRPLFGNYVGKRTYKKFYSKVGEAIINGTFKDGYSEMEKTVTCCIGGIYRETPYEVVFNTTKNLARHKLIVKNIDEKKSKINAKNRISLGSLGDRISIDFYSQEKGYWAEIKSEPIFQAHAWGTKEKNVTMIINELLKIPKIEVQDEDNDIGMANQFYAKNADLLEDKSFISRISEVLYDEIEEKSEEPSKRYRTIGKVFGGLLGGYAGKHYGTEMGVKYCLKIEEGFKEIVSKGEVFTVPTMSSSVDPKILFFIVGGLILGATALGVAGHFIGKYFDKRRDKKIKRKEKGAERFMQKIVSKIKKPDYLP